MISPTEAAVFFTFSFESSSSSPLPPAGNATALSYPVEPPRPLGSKKEDEEESDKSVSEVNDEDDADDGSDEEEDDD